jgi:hypothetical protein
VIQERDGAVNVGVVLAAGPFVQPRETTLELWRECVHIMRMTGRERWTSKIRCNDCGASATIVISEEDHPYETGSMGTRIEACPPGFEVISDAYGAREPRIICASCKTVVFDPRQRSG